MSIDRQIGSVAVVGCGITAWSAAAALKARIPSIRVSVVPAPSEPASLTDRIISTLPSVRGFHADIGLGEEDTVSRAGSGVRFGTEFEGWAKLPPSYIHAYDAYGIPVSGVPFHQLWLRDHERSSLPPFDSFSPSASRAKSAVHLPSPSGPSSPSGLQLTMARYAELMNAYALHLGVSCEHAAVRHVSLRSTDGFIEFLTLDDGEQVTADLFIDASGTGASLHSAMRPQFVDWSHWLPCDRILFREGPPDRDCMGLDKVSARAFGWHWKSSSPSRSTSGYVYASRHASDDAIANELDETDAEVIRLAQGRARQMWIRNCVAIGEAAVRLEPLEWTNLHIVHSQIDRIISMMPGVECAPVEIAEFNRQCSMEADRIRDFLCLHYATARRDEEFWLAARASALPDSLRHTLEQFSERGRLPYYEEETFARDSWLAVLIGQSFEPRHLDPLADVASPGAADEAYRMFTQLRGSRDETMQAATLFTFNPRGAR